MSNPDTPAASSSGADPVTIVQLVHIDETGDSYYRMRWPARDLTVQDPGIRLINLQHDAAERYELIEHADLAVLYQSHDLDLLPVIDRRRRAGKKTLVEYNDNFYAPATPSPVQEGWSSPLLWSSYELMIQAADGLLVTGPGLLELFSGRFPGKRIEVLENQLPFRPQPFEAAWGEREKSLNGGQIVIGWAGSVGHMADLISVAAVLRRIITRYPNVTVAIMGNESIPEVLNLPPGRFRFVNWGTMAQYFSFLGSLHIGIAPALDTPYNRCRSDIKAVELGSQAVVPVLAEILPYREFQRITGCLSFKDPAQLEEHLLRLIADPEEIRRRGAAAHEYVSKERIGTDHRKRLELYHELLPAQRQPIRMAPGPGYHEIAGTKETEYRSTKTLASVARLIQEQQLDSAAAVAQQAVAANPYSSDLLLQYLKVVRLKHRSIPDPARAEAARLELVQTLDRALGRFPADLRFALLRSGTAATAAEQAQVWESIIKRIGDFPPAARYFQKEVLRGLLAVLGRNPLLLPIAQQAAQIYPQFIPLRLELGKLLEHSGSDAEALGHFRAALGLIDLVNTNLETPANDRRYAMTWCEALEARLQQSGPRVKSA